MQRQLTFNFPKRVCFFSGRPMLQLKLYFPHMPRGIRGITSQYHLPIAAECFSPNEARPEDRPPPSPPNQKSWHQPTLFD
jgi:hypothetical protein